MPKRKVFHYSEIEEEIIFLKSIQEIIDEMINYEVFDLVGQDPHTNIIFKSMTHQKFFNIMLVDFLSPADSKIAGKAIEYLGKLKQICENPHFNYKNSISSLKRATQEFSDWLEQKFKEKIWLPSINREEELLIERKFFLKICGNISKHNFSRLSSVIENLQDIFQKNNINITFEESLSILDDFYEKFHYDILGYYASAIAEFLNNIRWGIHEYLLPEFLNSIVREKNSIYHSYTYPQGLNSNFAKDCYWELMNVIRGKPIVRKFKVSRYFKLRY